MERQGGGEDEIRRTRRQGCKTRGKRKSTVQLRVTRGAVPLIEWVDAETQSHEHIKKESETTGGGRGWPGGHRWSGQGHQKIAVRESTRGAECTEADTT